MRTVRLTKESTKDILENLLKRSPNNYGKFEAAVADILANVKEKGDEALFSYTKEFDKVEVTPETIRVTEEEIEEAYKAVDASLLEVIRKALVNIRSYHEKQRQLCTGLHICTGQCIAVLFIQYHDLRSRFILWSDKKHCSDNRNHTQNDTGKNNQSQPAKNQVKNLT